MPNDLLKLVRERFPADDRPDDQIVFEFGRWAEANDPSAFDKYAGFRDDYKRIVRDLRPSIGAEFAGSVGSAVDNAQASLLGAGAAVSDVVGADSMRDYFKRAAAEQEAQAAEYTPSVGSYRDIENASDLGRYIVYGAGQVAPSAAIAAATAGTGAAAGAGLAARGILGGMAIRQAAQIGAQAGLAAATIPQSVGEIYNETASPGLSLGFGAIAGALDMLPEGYIASKFFKEAAKKEAVAGARSFAKDFLRTAVKEAGLTVPGEGLTESAQEFLGIAAKKLNRGEDPMSLTREDYDQLLNAGLIGAIGGGVFAPVAAVGDMRGRAVSAQEPVSTDIETAPTLEAPALPASESAPASENSQLSPEVAAAVAKVSQALEADDLALGVAESAGPLEFGTSEAEQRIAANRALTQQSSPEQDALIAQQQFLNSPEGARLLAEQLREQEKAALVNETAQQAAQVAATIVGEESDQQADVQQVSAATQAAIQPQALNAEANQSLQVVPPVDQSATNGGEQAAAQGGARLGVEGAQEANRGVAAPASEVAQETVVPAASESVSPIAVATPETIIPSRAIRVFDNEWGSPARAREAFKLTGKSYKDMRAALVFEDRETGKVYVRGIFKSSGTVPKVEMAQARKVGDGAGQRAVNFDTPYEAGEIARILKERTSDGEERYAVLGYTTSADPQPTFALNFASRQEFESHPEVQRMFLSAQDEPSIAQRDAGRRIPSEKTAPLNEARTAESPAASIDLRGRYGEFVAALAEDIRSKPEAEVRATIKGVLDRHKLPASLVDFVLTSAKEVAETRVDLTVRTPSSYLIDQQRSVEIFRDVTNAIRSQGGEVAAFVQNLNSELEAIKGGYGLQTTNEEGRSLIGLGLKSLRGVDADATIKLLHEAAHQFIKSMPTDLQLVVQQAIDNLPFIRQKWLMNPFSTDLRLIANAPESMLSPVQRDILKGLAPEEINALRQINPNELIGEQAAEHLAMIGLEKGASRELLSQILRFFKDLLMRMGIAIQKTLGVQPHEQLVRAWVENQWLRFINRDFSKAKFQESLRVALGLPATFRDRVQVYASPESTDARLMHLDLATGQILSPEFVVSDEQSIKDDLMAMILAVENENQQEVSKTRRSVTTPVPLTTTIAANQRIAAQSAVGDVLRNLFGDSAIRLAIGNKTSAEFYSEFLNLSPSQFPDAVRASLLKELGALKDPIDGSPVSFDPASQINTLPSAEGGALGSAQQKAIAAALTTLSSIQSRVQTDFATSKEIFDRLTDREQAGKRPLSPAERKLKSDLGVRLETLKKILARLGDETGRLQTKLGATTDTPLYAGSTYRAPESPTDAPENWQERTVPIDLAFHPEKARELARDAAMLTEWARTPGNEKYGAQIGYAQRLGPKLMTLPVNEFNYSANTWRLLKSDTRGVFDMIRRIGTPAAQFLAGRFYDLESFITSRRQQQIVDGKKWSKAYSDLRNALGRGKQFEDIYQQQVYDPIIRTLELIDDGAPNVIGRAITALNNLYGLKIDTEKKRTAFRDFYLLTKAAADRDAQIFKDAGLSVKDEALGIERGLIRQGVVTGRRTFSKLIGALELTMRGKWTQLNDELIAKLAASPQQLGTLFTPTIVRDFVEPLVRNTVQTFDVAVDGGTRKAQLANVREAWTKSKGDIDAFAKELHALEGGDQRGYSATLKAILGNLRGKWIQVQNAVGANDAQQGAGFETMPRAMMDARVADDFPPEWVSYALYDSGSNLILLHQHALNRAFGRNGFQGGEFTQALAVVQDELEQMKNQLQSLVEQGLTKKDQIAQMGEDRYKIAVQATDHLRNVSRLTARIAFLTKTNGANFGDFRAAVEFLGLTASQILQNPRSSLLQLFEVLSPLYVMKFGKTGATQVANAIQYTSGDMLNGIFGVKVNADMAQRFYDAGIYSTDSMLSLTEQLADQGTANILAETSEPQTGLNRAQNKVSKVVRNIRTRVNYGPLDNLVAWFGKQTPQDMVAARTVAPRTPRAIKFSPFGLFNSVSQALIDGNAKAYVKSVEDFILRGFEVIRAKKAALSPEQFKAYLADLNAGALKFTATELGYDSTLGIFSDASAWNKLRDDIGAKMREGTPERLVATTWARLGGISEGQKLLTPQQIAAVATISDADVSLKSNSLNTPIDFITNPYLKAAGFFLTWPYLASIRALNLIQGRDAAGKMSARGAMEGMTALLVAILPATIAGSLLVDFYDEYLLGKKSNLREVGAKAAIPIGGLFADDPMAILERFARFGAFGFVGDAVNQMMNVDDARGGGISLDNRVLAVSWMRNFLDTGSRFYNQDFTATYATIYRPLLNLMGLNSVIQYGQLTNRALGLSNQEASVNNRISVGNYLRAEGRALKLDVRKPSQTGGIPTPVTPWIGEMEYAALADNYAGFRDAYQKAIKESVRLGKDDPVNYVRESFASRHPLRRVFRTSPSEVEYRRMLASLDPEGREAVTSAVNRFNRFMEKLGGKPFVGVSSSKRPAAPGKTLSLNQAHLMAAQAASGLDF